MTVVGSALRAPFGYRSRQDAAYAWVTVVPAVATFALFLLALVAAVASLVGVGLPLLAVCLALARRAAPVYRRPARTLLGWRWPAPSPSTHRLLRDREAWGALAYCAAKLPITVMAVFASTVPVVLGVAAVTSPLWWPVRHAVAGFGAGATWLDTVPFALQGAAVLLAVPWLLRLLVAIERTIVTALVVPRDDRRRIAALEASRRVLTEDATATLRRLERDLHDGTQARLISLGMMLRRAETRLDDSTARQLVGNAGRLVAETAHELREIIRGVHPPALDDGLGTALTSLASASAVPATFTDRLPAPVTGPAAAALYFGAAELLSNAARHSGAHHAEVSLTRVGPCVRLTVSDDGHGGATTSHTGMGTGLAGLQRRVQALDGYVQVHSPPGGPTVITADIPDD